MRLRVGTGATSRIGVLALREKCAMQARIIESLRAQLRKARKRPKGPRLWDGRYVDCVEFRGYEK